MNRALAKHATPITAERIAVGAAPSVAPLARLVAQCRRGVGIGGKENVDVSMYPRLFPIGASAELAALLPQRSEARARLGAPFGPAPWSIDAESLERLERVLVNASRASPVSLLSPAVGGASPLPAAATTTAMTPNAAAAAEDAANEIAAQLMREEMQHATSSEINAKKTSTKANRGARRRAAHSAAATSKVESKVEDAPDDDEEAGAVCAVCMVRSPTIVVEPCMDLCLCEVCGRDATMQKTCPACGGGVTDLISVFI